MKLEWKDDPSKIVLGPEVLTKELWAFGDPAPDGGRPYSYVGYVRRGAHTAVWRTHTHEFDDHPYWRELDGMAFKSRLAGMREMRKRFTVAWMSATPEERNNIWDGFK